MVEKMAWTMAETKVVEREESKDCQKADLLDDEWVGWTANYLATKMAGDWVDRWVEMMVLIVAVSMAALKGSQLVAKKEQSLAMMKVELKAEKSV